MVLFCALLCRQPLRRRAAVLLITRYARSGIRCVAGGAYAVLAVVCRAAGVGPAAAFRADLRSDRGAAAGPGVCIVYPAGDGNSSLAPQRQDRSRFGPGSPSGAALPNAATWRVSLAWRDAIGQLGEVSVARSLLPPENPAGQVQGSKPAHRPVSVPRRGLLTDQSRARKLLYESFLMSRCRKAEREVLQASMSATYDRESASGGSDQYRPAQSGWRDRTSRSLSAGDLLRSNCTRVYENQTCRAAGNFLLLQPA